MISYLQDLLQRRGKPIFLILLAVIIVAFVFVIGEQPGIVTGDRRGQEGARIFGYDFETGRDPAVQSLIADTQLSFLLREARPIFSEQEFEEEILMRAAYLDMLERYGIPRPDSETIRFHLESLPVFLDADGNFDRRRFNQFLDMQVMTPDGGEERLARVLEEDWRIERLRSALIHPSFVRPVEALALARREQTRWTVQVARLDLKSLEIEVDPSDDSLQRYFVRHSERYQRPERLQTRKATFKAAAFAGQVEDPDSATIKQWMGDRGDRFDADDMESFLNSDTPQDHPLWDSVVERWREARQFEIANRMANDFAFTLYDEGVTLFSETFHALVERYGAELEEVPPFSQQADPAEIGLPRRTLERAFRLDQNRYFSDPFEVEGGVAVLLLEERLPAHIPPFEEIRDEVSADYQAEEVRLRFAEKGETLRTQLRQALLDGTPFDEKAEELGFRVMSDFESFTVIDPPTTLPRHLVPQLSSMEKGELSPFRIMGEEGFVLYVMERAVPELSVDDLAALAQARQQLARISQRQVNVGFVNEVLRRELEGEARK